MLLVSGRACIDIWEDNWVLNFSSLADFWVPSRQYVSQLISVFTSNWDTRTINTLFPSNISLAILSITLPVIPRSGCLVWPATNCKCYSVKSGYRALSLARSLKPEYSPSSSFVPSSLCKIIWKLEMAPKIKKFIWACNSKAIPSKRALWVRKCSYSPPLPCV